MFEICIRKSYPTIEALCQMKNIFIPKIVKGGSRNGNKKGWAV